MTAPTHFHLFVAQVLPEHKDDYLAWAADDAGDNPPLLHELGLHDFQVQGDEANYGFDVLVPDFRYTFTLEGLFNLSLLQPQDLPAVAEVCDEKGIVPNSCITLYRQGLKLTPPVQLSFPGVHYVGEFEMELAAREEEQFINPHLFLGE